MRLTLAFIFALCATPAHAAWDCLPTPPVRTVSTPAGDAWAWWCKVNTAADGTTQWQSHTFVVLKKYRDPSRFVEAAVRAVSAADPIAQANAEMDAARVVPASDDEYQFNLLGWKACQEVIRKPWPALFSPAPTCGTEPTPPVTAAWTATGGTIFTASGTRLTGATTRKAPVGAPCDPVTPIVVGPTTYLPLIGGAVTERTACRKQ
jgi:hypothetical protein